MKSLIEFIKKSPKTILVTLEAIWVILLSFMGKFIFSVNFDICGSVDFMQVLEFFLLFIGIIAYGRAFIKYKEHYEISSEKDKKNLSDWLVDSSIERKRIDFFLWPALDKSWFLWHLIIFVLAFVVYLFIR
ncbi:MAG: hypothetical protein VZR53_08975 [Prevotella sp.]|nr:hypothetical protein [Prevotella sp.]